ncbi:TPA: DUF551 domain-containing protein [Klebsiella pneumoniae]|nr:DUF551 domain-containing protein [Klebsiella pneumoniae]
MKFEEWLSQQNGVIEVDCGCVTTEAFYHWMRVAYEAGNSPVIPDGWTCNDKANAALMMLDRIETADPVDDDRIDGIKRIVRELAAATHGTTALNSVQNVATVPDKWIPVSERMPDENAEQQVLACFKGGDISTLYYFEGRWDDAYGIVPIRQDVTHWMPLPAGPQEVR